MSKRVAPSRIATFSSRIPVPGQIQTEVTRTTKISQKCSSDGCSEGNNRQLSKKDLGRKVRVADKDGFLRFVGNVHFASGVWCGVELLNTAGKNDGCIRGVRYFACPAARGLMAPLSKVELIEEQFEEISEDAASGPYSIIFGVDKEQLANSTFIENENKRTYVKDNETENVCNETVIDPKRRRTYTTEEIEKSVNGHEHNFLQINNNRKCTYNTTETNKNISANESNDTFENVNQTIIYNGLVCEDRNKTFDKEVCCSNNQRAFAQVNETVVLKNKNYIYRESPKETALNETFVHTNEKKGFPSSLNSRKQAQSNSCDNCSSADTTVTKKYSETLEKPASFPQLRNFENLDFENPPATGILLNRFSQSIPLRDIEKSPRKLRFYNNSNIDDDSSKRDSLEFEESLGILTPEQMLDVNNYFASGVGSRTPSSENIGSLPSDAIIVKSKSSDLVELPSPNLVDYSLGILDENVMNFTLKSDTTTNMELPLDSVGKSKDFTFTRLEQTPSPEDLPLDPTPIVVESDSKTENTAKSKTTSSFITSITSITSLDTGYQGDGEMSRPASRGADNSPLTRRPLPRPQPRRQDPMTDSDFYTESDADNHEEHPLRGDRKAQVIDGTLYGVDPQAAADLYVNNRENMDSSGIFTDIESNTRADELSSVDNERQHATIDTSPSDSSSKTISDNSQNNVLAIISNKTPPKTESVCNITQESRQSVDSAGKRSSPSPSTVASSPSSVRSPRHSSKEETTLKKYKMPKRNVSSKIKAMMEPSVQQKNNENKTNIINKVKTVGRWDAVMNKISKSQSEQTKTNLKDVKSKVFSSVSLQSPGSQSPSDKTRKTNLRRIEGSNQKSPSTKQRRIRTRANTTSTPSKNNVESSIHSSLSDLSGISPIKKSIGSAKKRDVVRVTQVLTATKLSPKTSPQNADGNAKRKDVDRITRKVTAAKVSPGNSPQNAAVQVKKTSTNTSLPTESKVAKRSIFSSTKEKKQTPSKECGRGTVKGGRASPGARPPTQSRAPTKPAPRTTEALAVLVQHLVFNLEAFRVPSLRKEVEKAQLETKEARLLCRQLEETLSEEKHKHASAIEEVKAHFRAEIAELIEQHRAQIAQLNHQHSEIEQRLIAEKESSKHQLQKINDEQLKSLKLEFNKLQKTHQESLIILREENDAIREEIDEKNATISKLDHYKFESEKLKKDYEIKETTFKEKLQTANDEISRLKEQMGKIMNFTGDPKDNSMQEVQSLQAVLELKQSEVSELRRQLAEANEKAELLPFAAEKASAFKARCDDLKLQLERKSQYEQQLLAENKRLQESFKEECNQKKRLSQHNEELQWKLKQNIEVFSHVLDQAEESGAFSRSLLSSSFNERHSTTRPNFERTFSFKERTFSNKSGVSTDGSSNKSRKSKNSVDLDLEEMSPPSSPKVKGVVEKSDSVSYVLDLDESPEVVASRIMRRSFRNSTPPKNTPTKSPANKRPRMKNNPLSLSASASSIIPSNKNEHPRSRSVSVRNGEYDSSSGSSSHNDNNIFTWDTSTPKYNNGSADNEKLANDSFGSNMSSVKLEDNLDLDEDNDMDIKIPTLPSEIGRKNQAQALPVPRHLAGEAMVSESNSEDESTTSSSSVL